MGALEWGIDSTAPILLPSRPNRITKHGEAKGRSDQSEDGGL